MSLVLQSSGGGSVTIAEPTTASNFTQTLPAADGTSILANGSGDLQMNSGYGSNATAYGCRAWVNFNGTGTVAIRASGNVSSITDNGTGDYTVNFTTAMPDANSSVAGCAAETTAVGGVQRVFTLDTLSNSNTRVFTSSYDSFLGDAQIVCVSVFR
jgi:hypothetical protein